MLVDSKCLAALKKIGLDKGAEAMALQIEEVCAVTGSITMDFLSEDEPADAKYIAKLTVTVEKVG